MKITRILFCPICFEQKRPHKGSWFMTMSDVKNQFVEAELLTDHHEFGFTPHLVELKEILGNTVYHNTLCLMDGCGIEIIRNEDGDKQLYTKFDTVVFLLDEKQYYFDKYKILCEVTKSTVLHYKARIVKQPEEHTCTLGNWTALVDLFETPKI